MSGSATRTSSPYCHTARRRPPTSMSAMASTTTCTPTWSPRPATSRSTSSASTRRASYCSTRAPRLAARSRPSRTPRHSAGSSRNPTTGPRSSAPTRWPASTSPSSAEAPSSSSTSARPGTTGCYASSGR